MDRRTDGQKDRWTEGQMDRHAENESVYIHSGGGTKRQMNEGTYGQTERFLDKHTNGWIDDR